MKFYIRAFLTVVLALAPIATLKAEEAGQYLGCFKDTGNPRGADGRVLDGLFIDEYIMLDIAEKTGLSPVDACIAFCRDREFKYAGDQFGHQCFCGDGDYKRAGAADSCQMSGNKMSGSTWSNAVYATGVTNPPKQRSGPSSIQQQSDW